MSAKVQATANCEFCQWAATHRADTVLEVADFLRRLLVQHCTEAHADRCTGEGVPS